MVGVQRRDFWGTRTSTLLALAFPPHPYGFVGDASRKAPTLSARATSRRYGHSSAYCPGDCSAIANLRGNEPPALCGPDPLSSSGLRLVPVVHSGNQSESAEEAEVVSDLVHALTDDRLGCTWINAEGVEQRVGRDDILVVAPYNAQVAEIAKRVGVGVRVGTVDKFQGQEALVVIYSMTTSSAADAPRGMEFLYSPNLLNVATSRARCVAIVVSSPELFVPECRPPQQMRLANAFCRYRELATEWLPDRWRREEPPTLPVGDLKLVRDTTMDGVLR
jgi:hypothetical protein